MAKLNPFERAMAYAMGYDPKTGKKTARYIEVPKRKKAPSTKKGKK